MGAASKRVVEIVVELWLVLLAAFLASKLALPLVIIPRMLHTKLAHLSAGQVGQVAVVFGAVHAGAFLAASLAQKWKPAVSSPRRFLVELYFALAATSLASSGLFMASPVPFSVKFYAWIYVLVVALLTGLFVIALAWRRLRVPAAPAEPAAATPQWRDAFRLVPTPWTAVTLGVVSLPAVLAVLYKKSADFATLVNNTRMAIRDAGNTKYALVDAWEGGTFEQPMWGQFDPQDPKRFYLLSRPGRLYRYTTAPQWGEELLLDLSKVVNTVDSEMGALAFALHPDFGRPGSASGGFVYVLHNAWTPKESRNCLSRFDLSLPTPQARLDSRLVLIDQKRPPTGQHNGGSVHFGNDGFLYLTIGDYMTTEGQRLDGRLASGVLRIDVDCRGGGRSTPIRRQPKTGPPPTTSSPPTTPGTASPIRSRSSGRSASATPSAPGSTRRPASCGSQTWASSGGRNCTACPAAATGSGPSWKAPSPSARARRPSWARRSRRCTTTARPRWTAR